MEALSSSETSVLTRAKRRTIPVNAILQRNYSDTGSSYWMNVSGFFLKTAAGRSIRSFVINKRNGSG
jgi:hypothetical protein